MASEVTVDHAYVFVVVEDEPDMQLLISMMLQRDQRLELVGHATSAAEASALLDTEEVRALFDRSPGLIVLDHGIEGDLMGLEAAPVLKAKVPSAKILLFTAFDMSKEAAAEPAVDGFLRKDQIGELLHTAQRLLGLEERRSAPRAP
jgi:CheY-like chemotaxis protein